MSAGGAGVLMDMLHKFAFEVEVGTFGRERLALVTFHDVELFGDGAL